MEIRPLTETERKYAFPQSMQIQGQTGCIGHLRGEFDRDRGGVFTSWDGCWEERKTDAFQTELEDAINDLRSEECGLLRDCPAMDRYTAGYPESRFSGTCCMEHGFRAETENHVFLIRCNPTKGEYNFYCYVKEWLDSHIREAGKGIRFINSRYEELFRIADGEKITVTYPDGEKREQLCRYIDEYHTEVGSHLFHICQFAEIMEQNGASYAPGKPEAREAVERGRVEKTEKRTKSR